MTLLLSHSCHFRRGVIRYVGCVCDHIWPLNPLFMLHVSHIVSLYLHVTRCNKISCWMPSSCCGYKWTWGSRRLTCIHCSVPTLPMTSGRTAPQSLQHPGRCQAWPGTATKSSTANARTQNPNCQRWLKFFLVVCQWLNVPFVWCNNAKRRSCPRTQCRAL